MPTTSLWRAAIDELAGRIEQAEGVGKVFSGEESVDTLAEILELAAEPITEDEFLHETQKINCWQVMRTSVQAARAPDLPRQQRWRVHSIRIRGWLGMGEGTWERFQEIVDNVLDKLEGIDNIAFTRETGSQDFMDVDPPSASIGFDNFSVYGCHYCEMTMTLRERRLVPAVHSL